MCADSETLPPIDEEVCASCGKAAVDNITLKICTACKLVRYCSVECQKNHRPQHKKACKKRAAEIRDDRLFSQPDDSCYGECPICSLPLPTDIKKYAMMNSCCCKFMCNGCVYANKKREAEQGLEQKCPYCREPLPKTDEEIVQNELKRAKANDPVGLLQVGTRCDLKGDHEGAMKYWTKAASLGDMDAHYNVSNMYREGGVEIEKDKKKEIYHLKEAAIGGHPLARYNLGCGEHRAGMFDRAAKHYIIAAKLGLDDALEAVKEGFAAGVVKKDDFEAALRGHQAAVDATKSEQREEADAFFNKCS